MHDLILEMQELLATAVKRGDSAACDDAKLALEKLQKLNEQVMEIEDQLNAIQAAGVAL